MRGNATRVSKFTFTYHDLAYRVRENMLNSLQPYDKNFNGQFEEPQIVQALVNILNEDENEIQYVVSNVFRYDKDGDKAVTYDEFVNFAVEQHFGELAIQRLHRKGLYSRGKQRLMNLDQFETTLNESLKYIASQGSRDEYEHVFNEVDLDHDGWIKYEDFFIFLKEYFGSQSVAANTPLQQQPDSAVTPDAHQQIEFPQEKFARLIYTQLKVSVMEHDLTKSISLRRQQVGNILQNVFRVQSDQKNSLINLIVGGEEVISYERFMKVMVPFYFCEYDIQRSGINQVNEEDFINCVRNACYFVMVKPSSLVLREIFHKADSGQKGFLDRGEYINTLGIILENYEFDSRGMGRPF